MTRRDAEKLKYSKSEIKVESTTGGIPITVELPTPEGYIRFMANNSRDYIQAIQEGRVDDADKIRHNIWLKRKAWVEGLSNEEDREPKTPRNAPVEDAMRNALVVGDTHINGGGMQAVINDINNPGELDSANIPSNDPDQGPDYDI